jgi:plastocyanin
MAVITGRQGAVALLVVACLAPPGADAGTVSGRVVFRGQPPVLGPVRITKDREVCGETVPAEALVVSAETRGVASTVVAVEGVGPGPDATPSSVTLENRQCRFVPHVLAARAGDELAIVNRDPVLHNIRAWLEDAAGRRSVLNVVQPTQGQVSRRVLRRTGTFIVTCDAHPHMLAYLLVFDHPHFAVTGADGEFQIPDVPAGTYRLRAWHEAWKPGGWSPDGKPRLAPPAELVQEVRVPGTGIIRVLFELAEEP